MKMLNETNLDELNNILHTMCLRNNLDEMENSVLKISLQHYVSSESNQTNHRDRHTDHSDCTCLIGGI